MGFDRYHEPASELPEATPTFARRITSPTDEAETINWYAQQDEFMHFSMDLGPLLRATPDRGDIARGVLSREVDILQLGVMAEKRAG